MSYFFFFNKYFKKFSYGIAFSGGRNFLGRICVHHKGGGQKNKFLKIDRYRFLNQYGVILRIISDFYRTGFLGLVVYDNGLVNFILLSEGVIRGYRIFSGDAKIPFIDFTFGSVQKILNIKLFDSINSIELFPFSGAKVARSAGVSASIFSKENLKSLLKMKSGWQIVLSNHSLASLGVVSNLKHGSLHIEKAGVNRLKGIRPTVRGVIKNPCDHPHGGGEGKGSPPVAQVSP
jgi:large subunit ribosomal protein L2